MIPGYLINIQNDNSIPIQFHGNLINILINKEGRILLNSQPTSINSFEKELYSHYFSDQFIVDRIYISLKIQDGIDDKIREQISQCLVRSIESYYDNQAKRIYNVPILELSKIQKQDLLTRIMPITWYENFKSSPKPIIPKFVNRIDLD